MKNSEPTVERKPMDRVELETGSRKSRAWCSVVLSKMPALAVAIGLIVSAAQTGFGIDGPGKKSASPFRFGIVEIAVYSAAEHEQWICTGTLVAPTWVLTSANCPGAASDTSVFLESTQSSSVLEVVAHPSLPLALLLLSTPMTTANRTFFPEIAPARPANASIVNCFGYGQTNTLNSAPFGVIGNGNNYMVDSGANVVEWPGDEGGPCMDNSVGSNGVLRIVGVITSAWTKPAGVTSGTGVTGNGAAGEPETDSVGQWIADMIHLDGLKWGHYSYSIINKHSTKAFDVANGSLLPNSAVNQYHLNGGLNQNWYFEYTNYPFMRMVNARSGKCLDADPNYQLRQSTCGPATSQLFRIIYTGNTYANVVAYNTFVVDVPFAYTDDGVRLQIYPWNGGDNQLWYLGIH
jgi:hypothetical protein